MDALSRDVRNGSFQKCRTSGRVLDGDHRRFQKWFCRVDGEYRWLLIRAIILRPEPRLSEEHVIIFL